MVDVAYTTVDVFTNRQFGGNQLAVIPDARGLDTETMQAIAAEFGYAETTFVLPPGDQAHTAQVRIFTPKLELPFAGHPNVGTAFVLARQGSAFGRRIAAAVIFEETAGLVPIDIVRRGRDITGAMLTAPQALTKLGDLPPATVAAWLGLAPEDVKTGTHPPLALSVGVPFVVAELRDAATVSRCVANIAAMTAHGPPHGAAGLHVYAHTAAQSLHCRMFGTWAGVAEDAATGSANVGLTALLADLSPDADLQLELDIRQGIEMGRPSRLYGRAEKAGGRVIRAQIGGDCVVVMEGRIHLRK